MALSWVNLTQEKPKQNAAMQRQVRAEAMRDTRRRQKTRKSSTIAGQHAQLTGCAVRTSTGRSDVVSLRHSLDTPERTYASFPGTSLLRGKSVLVHDNDSESFDGSDVVISPCISLSESDLLISAYVELSNTRPHVTDLYRHGSFASTTCLYALGLRPWLLSQRHAFMLKSHALRIANQRLNCTETSLSDQTLSMLVELTFHEMCNNSSTALVHLQGIGKIIALRGGMDNLVGADGVTQAAVADCDMIYAILHNKQPLFTILDEPSVEPISDLKLSSLSPRLIESAQHYDLLSQPVYFSPLLRNNSAPAREELSFLPDHTIAILEAMLCLTGHFFTFEGPQVLCTRCYEPVTCLLDNGNENDAPVAHETTDIAEACRLTAVIYTRALVEGIPFDHQGHVQHADALFRTISGIETDLIEKIPFVILWLMLVSSPAIAAVQPNPSLFATIISKIGRVTGFKSSSTTRKLLSNFLWMQKRLRGEAWPFAADYKDRAALKIMIDRRNAQREAFQTRQVRAESLGEWEWELRLVRLLIAES